MEREPELTPHHASHHTQRAGLHSGQRGPAFRALLCKAHHFHPKRSICSLFSRAPPRGFFSAPRGAISAARRRRRKFSGGGQACDFRAGCGLLGKLTCGGRCLVIDGDGHDAAPRRGRQSPAARNALNSQSGPLRAQARSANGDGATRVGRCGEGSPAR